MANVLEKIVADKRIEVEARKRALPLADFINELTPSTRDFFTALAKPGTNFILECKKASPSKGLIREHFNLKEITNAYKHYAACISVLTDEKYFQGSYDYLTQVRELVEQPLICKDFFIDEYQVYLARKHGGDAILLMLSVLTDEQYRKLASIAKSLNMSILTEVSNEEETQRALALDADIIGINNRNLRDLSTDLATTEQLRALIPDNKVVISESGIYTHSDVKRLQSLCNGFLVGSSLMAEIDLDVACRKLVVGENKVCGLTRSQDAEAAYEAGAVYGGLIFYAKSPRYIDLDCAKTIVDSAPLAYVGVFVNEAIEKIVDHVAQLNLKAVQLHGNEDAEFIQTLKTRLPKTCQIWKAVSVTDVIGAKVTGADRYLFDAKVGDQVGGTGHSFDWQLLNNESNFMLAGGLDQDNIEQALSVGALGLDLNSGVELSPGKKCHTKINHVFAKIREF